MIQKCVEQLKGQKSNRSFLSRAPHSKMWHSKVGGVTSWPASPGRTLGIFFFHVNFCCGCLNVCDGDSGGGESKERLLHSHFFEETFSTWPDVAVAESVCRVAPSGNQVPHAHVLTCVCPGLPESGLPKSRCHFPRGPTGWVRESQVLFLSVQGRGRQVGWSFGAQESSTTHALSLSTPLGVSQGCQSIVFPGGRTV